MTASTRYSASSSHQGTVAPGGAPTLGLPPLRGYQEEAVAEIVEGLTAAARGTVVAACGTGKTLVSAYAAGRLVDEGLMVVACPSLPLIAQTLREFTRFGVAARALAVCSDDTIADAAVHLCDLPCPVTTDPGRIAAWLRTSGPGERGLMLVTHLSADAAGQGLRDAGVTAGLLVVDEAHRTAGWAGKRARFLHTDDGLPARRRLYLTATPRVLTGGGRGPREDMLSMDDVDTFGRCFYTYPFARAIQDGWLDEYRLAVVGVTHQEALAVLRGVGRGASADGEDRLIRAAVVQTALARAAVEFGLRRIMVFCPWIRDSQHFAATLQATIAGLPADQRPKGRLTSIHVDGGHSHASRQKALDLLAEPPEDGWTVLSNARCLAEGVDVPAVDAVVFTAPKRSQIDIVQAVGRALRRNPHGSGIATILVPVLLPDDPNTGDEDLGEWETLCQVVRALQAHDDGLATALNIQRAKVRADQGRAPGPPDDQPALPPQVVLRLPDTHQVHDLLHHITVRVLEGTTSDWWVGYGALVRFHQHHGHVRVPWQHVQDGVNLYTWIAKRRAEYKKKKLAPDRVEALNQLGLPWTPGADAEQRLLDAVIAFHAEHGHLRVPTSLDPPYQWLCKRRRAYHDGTLDPELARLLTDMGMDWQTTTLLSFDDYYALAQQYHATHGHLNIPRGYTIDGADLYQWLVRQRHLANNNHLPDRHRQALDELGMVWSPRHATWAARYAAAAAYLAREGHLTPPAHHREGGIILSKWLSEQRRLDRAHQLPPDRRAALVRLGIVDSTPPAKPAIPRMPTKHTKKQA